MAQLLRINLTDESIKIEEIPKETLRKVIGGRGLAAYILLKELPARIDPLSEDNKLVFAVGPFNGLLPSKYVVAAKSPQTDILGFALASGLFSWRLRMAGYYALVVEGSSDKPKYIFIEDEKVEIRDASKLWGLTTNAVENELKKELGENFSIASIGPAGENLVRYACVINDGRRAAGRTGMGAVMGSKKLKAIAVKGNKKPDVANKELFKKVWGDFIQEFMKKDHWAIPYGTSGGIAAYSDEMGCLPTRNFTSGTFEGAEKITGEGVLAKWTVKRLGCPACPVNCWGEIEIKNGKSVKYFRGPRPEYESIAALGPTCGIDDIETIVLSNDLCNKLGIDTISTGVTIAFAMECFEKGLLTESETDGLKLNFGSSEILPKLIEKIAYKQGFGKMLSEGTRRLSQKIGKGSEAFAVHVKGLELPMHEPRPQKGFGLAYATSSRGACHNRARGVLRGETIPELGFDKDYVKKDDPRSITGKALQIKKTQDLRAVEDSLVVCYFVGIPPRILLELYRTVIGADISFEEFLKCGERIVNIERLFNVREGITRKDDALPKRIHEPLRGGVTDGLYISEGELNKMLDEYYMLRGWEVESGIPTREKLKDLDISEFDTELNI